MDGIPVKIIYSRRKTLSMKFDKTGTLIVNAPSHVTEGEVRTFMREHTRWIRLNYVKAMSMAENLKEGVLHDFLKNMFPLTYQRKYPDGRVVTMNADTNEEITE